MIPITPFPLLNCLVCAIAFSLLGMVVTWGFLRVIGGEKSPRLRLVFTKEGIARQRANVTDFVVATRFRVYPLENGIAVLFADGEQIDIPWSAVENPAALGKQEIPVTKEIE